MSTINDFELASRQAIRFDTGKVQLTTEQLWDLPLEGSTSLDSIAVDLYKQFTQETGPLSFVKETKKVSPEQNLLDLKFRIIQRIIDVRLAEKKLKEAKSARDKEAAYLRNLIQEQKQAADRNLDLATLEARLAALSVEE